MSLCFSFCIQFLAVICIALLRHYNLYFGGEYNQASYHDRYLFGVISIGGMLLVTIPIFIAHLFGSEIKPGLVHTFFKSNKFLIFIYLILYKIQDLIYSTMGFVLFLTAGILSIDYYLIYRNRPGNLNAGRSLGVYKILKISFLLRSYLTNVILYLQAVLVINSFFFLLNAVSSLMRIFLKD